MLLNLLSVMIFCHCSTVTERIGELIRDFSWYLFFHAILPRTILDLYFYMWILFMYLFLFGKQRQRFFIQNHFPNVHHDPSAGPCQSQDPRTPPMPQVAPRGTCCLQGGWNQMRSQDMNTAILVMNVGVPSWSLTATPSTFPLDVYV